MPVYTQLFQDTFQRPNEDPLDPALWIENQSFQVPLGQLEIVSHQCEADDAADGSLETANVSIPSDQYVEVVVGTFTTFGFIEIGFRSQDLNGYNSYTLGFDVQPNGANMSLNTEVGGTFGQELALAVVPNPQPGDVFRIESVGKVLTVKYNGVMIIEYTDNANIYPTSPCGPSLYISPDAVSSDTTVTRFTAGSIQNPVLPAASDDKAEGFVGTTVIGW